MIGASILAVVASAAAATWLLITCSGGDDEDLVDEQSPLKQDSHSFVELAILQLKSGGKVGKKNRRPKEHVSPVSSSQASPHSSQRGVVSDANVLEIHSKPKPETAAVKKR
uniref:Uncharacterized protein n=1 Tax=Trichuris muris TaxID=70415 RepID=A0A5S6Q3X4_TRIMR